MVEIGNVRQHTGYIYSNRDPYTGYFYITQHPLTWMAKSLTSMGGQAKPLVTSRDT